jgi:hypothetical protein
MVVTSSLLRGTFGVPGAASDGTPTGLSADERTLVLADVPGSYPPSRTRLLVLNAPDVRVRGTIVLPGFFTVDAISPAGRWLYLTHYLSGLDPTRYEVRAFDLARRQLLAKPLVDPRQPDEKMHGFALTRAMSADGRWAYTLYQSAIGGTPFVHALDTVKRAAFCVDLPALSGLDVGGLTLALSHAGRVLQIEQAGTPVAVMDTRTLAVGRPAPAPAPPRPRSSSTAGNGSGALWAPGIGLSAVLIGLVLLARRRRWIRSRARPAAARIDDVSKLDS